MNYFVERILFPTTIVIYDCHMLMKTRHSNEMHDLMKIRRLHAEDKETEKEDGAIIIELSSVVVIMHSLLFVQRS